jgi:hypothetical protein
MGGGVKHSSEFLRDTSVSQIVERVGALPDAPLAMPTQRLEAEPGARLFGSLARLIGLDRFRAYTARRGGN